MTQLRREVKLLLFLSSYLPLFAVLSFQYRSEWMTIYDFTLPYISILFASVCFISIPFLFLVVRVQSTSNPDFKEVDEYRRRNDQVTSYLLVYVFAFVGLDLLQLNSLVAFSVFFVMVAIIQIQSSQLHVNPVLAVFGYDIYQVKSGPEIALVVSDIALEDAFVSTDRKTNQPDATTEEQYLKLAELGNGVYITSNDVNGN